MKRICFDYTYLLLSIDTKIIFCKMVWLAIIYIKRLLIISDEVVFYRLAMIKSLKLKMFYSFNSLYGKFKHY